MEEWQFWLLAYSIWWANAYTTKEAKWEPFLFQVFALGMMIKSLLL